MAAIRHQIVRSHIVASQYQFSQNVPEKYNEPYNKLMEIAADSKYSVILNDPQYESIYEEERYRNLKKLSPKKTN